jgi:hypothetical protein
VLRRARGGVELISNGPFLMDTSDGRSERLLVEAALQRHDTPRDVLIGGLGVSFSLVTALSDARVRRVTVAEIEPAPKFTGISKLRSSLSRKSTTKMSLEPAPFVRARPPGLRAPSHRFLRSHQ